MGNSNKHLELTESSDGVVQAVFTHKHVTPGWLLHTPDDATYTAKFNFYTEYFPNIKMDIKIGYTKRNGRYSERQLTARFNIEECEVLLELLQTAIPLMREFKARE